MTIWKIHRNTEITCLGIWIRYLTAHIVSSLGFYFGKPTEESQIYDSNTYVKEYTYLGIVGEICDGRCKIEQRNKFSVGETIEIMKPDGENVEVTVKRIINEEGEDQESAPHSKQVLYIELEGGQASPYDILRRQEPEVQ